MKAFFKCVGIVLLVLAAASVANAQERPALGWAHFSLKADYAVFSSDLWKDNDIEQVPIIALEGYGSIFGNLYLGGEIGYGQATSEVSGVDTELTIFPMELNLKYAIDLGKHFKFDAGGGFCYIRADGELDSTTITGTKDEGSAWGAQGFIDLQLVFDRFLVGANFKYQTTEEILDDADLTHYRGGVQIGILF